MCHLGLATTATATAGATTNTTSATAGCRVLLLCGRGRGVLLLCRGLVLLVGLWCGTLLVGWR